MMSDKLRNTVLLIFTVVWAVNIIVPSFVKDYETIPELNAAFMGIIGVIVAGRRSGGEDEAPSPSPDSTPPESRDPNTPELGEPR